MTTIATMEEINNVDINAWRHGYKWNINECLRLEREYDLLKLSVPEMAILHKRSINAIMCKLQDEGLDTYNNLYVRTFGKEGTLEDHLDEQIDKLNNLSSFADEEDAEEEDDEEEDDENDEDYEDEEEEDDEDDEDYDDEDYTENVIYEDGSNHAYVYDQVKRMHKHITNLLGYFTKVSSKSNKSVSSNAY
jgi:hypothetical protein